jgi:hypothetical protein
MGGQAKEMIAMGCRCGILRRGITGRSEEQGSGTAWPSRAGR